MTGALGFGEVVGQDDAKLALLLAACEPRLGGVLLRGEKGSAKTTLARGLAHLLPGDAPFVELPLGATEDRVLGSIDTAHLLSSGEVRVRPGLLAAADGGVLYVDEVNLLADHLVDALLDAAASGRGRIERDGVSHEFPARFVLIGSMNPEEGELRPQLLDRFGLAVDILAPTDAGDRAEVVRRQLARERGEAAVDDDGDLRARLADRRPADLPDEVIDLACRVALEVGAEGLRADLMLARAAAALAGWEGRPTADDDDLRRVAPFVLAHRRRRSPFDAPGIDPGELDDAFDEAERERDDPTPPEPEGEAEERVVDAGPEVDLGGLPTPKRPPPSQRRGRFVRAVADGDPDAPLAVAATATAVAERRAVDPSAGVDAADLRTAVTQEPASSLVLIAVDTSSSMGTDERIALAKGAVLGLLTDAYQQRDRVALVAFRGERAEVVLRPTGSVEVARTRLADLPVGGTTPLADALDTLRELAARTGDAEPVVVLVTDGRATAGGEDPLADAEAAADRLAGLGAPTLVVDAEHGVPRLGLAAELSRRLGGRHVRLADLDGGDLARQIRELTR